MKNNTKRIVFAILIIINCLIIFYFSSQVADNSSSQSSRVVEFVSNILPFINNMEENAKTNLKEEILTPIVRKTAHLSLYAILGIFTMNFINTFKKLKTSEKITYSILFCMLYACTDEFHQIFVERKKWGNKRCINRHNRCFNRYIISTFYNEDYKEK